MKRSCDFCTIFLDDSSFSDLYRFVLDPGTIDESNNFTANPLSKEPDGTTDIADEVKAVCNAVWTTSIKDAYKAHLIATKDPS